MQVLNHWLPIVVAFSVQVNSVFYVPPWASPKMIIVARNGTMSTCDVLPFSPKMRRESSRKSFLRIICEKQLVSRNVHSASLSVKDRARKIEMSGVHSVQKRNLLIFAGFAYTNGKDLLEIKHVVSSDSCMSFCDGFIPYEFNSILIGGLSICCLLSKTFVKIVFLQLYYTYSFAKQIVSSFKT